MGNEIISNKNEIVHMLQKYSMTETLNCNVKLLLYSLLYLVVVGGGNLIGLGVMMCITSQSLIRVVLLTITTTVTLPFSLVMIVLTPLWLVPAINRYTYSASNTMLGLYIQLPTNTELIVNKVHTTE